MINPDQLRLSPEAIDFVRAFARDGKPIAAVCHGPSTLIDAGAVRGRRVTSWPSLKTDLANAGAEWVDQPVVTDRGLVTSRKSDDLPDFCRKMIEEFVEGRHPRAGERAATRDLFALDGAGRLGGDVVDDPGEPTHRAGHAR